MYISRYDIEDISGMSSSDVSKFLISVKRHLPIEYHKEKTIRREEVQNGRKVTKIFNTVKVELYESIISTQKLLEKEHRFSAEKKIQKRLNTLLTIQLFLFDILECVFERELRENTREVA